MDDVTIKDIEEIVKAVAMRIIENGAQEKFVRASESERFELVKKCLEIEIEKTKKMQDLYLTNPTFRAGFRNLIFGMCKECSHRKETGRG